MIYKDSRVGAYADETKLNREKIRRTSNRKGET
jgi:hypothetical protein